jgi:Mg2+/Co2+ transporter CorB
VESLPLWAQLSALFVLLLLSAFFSISETSMMALNRHRLSHLVNKGRRGAKLATELLGQTEKLLGTILLGNNVANTALTAIVTSLAISHFGNNDRVVLMASTVVALLIIIFCEITPKVFGATYPERIALPASGVLKALMTIAAPFVWAVNLIVRVLLMAIGVRTGAGQETRLSTEELRTIVLDSGQFMPHKHRSILLNLFDLEHITVDDVMAPRSRIEALNLEATEAELRDQLTTCYHNKMPVYEGEINRVVGMLHIRRALSLLQRESFDSADIREVLSEPYFIPSGTPVFKQLQFFQENRQRLGMVVDEYGEVLGLVTLEDIIEEIVGEFTTTGPGRDTGLEWDEDDTVMLEGTAILREINRRLGTRFPLDGPRTLNGLLLEALQELPEADVSVRFGDVIAEITQIENRTIRSVRLHRLGRQGEVGHGHDGHGQAGA